MSRGEDAIMSSNSLVPRARTTDDLVPGVIKVGPYDVRIRRNWGVGAPRWVFDVLDVGPHGEPVRVTTFCSHPSPDDCFRAINHHRAGRSVAQLVDEASARASAEIDRFARHLHGAPTAVAAPKLRGVAAARSRNRKAGAS